jgi:predicted HicB family RNase H-like nuclease
MVRLPEELLDAIRRKAAEETIKRNERVSVNTLVVEILSKAVKPKGR